jgi:hypothetical protein
MGGLGLDSEEGNPVEFPGILLRTACLFLLVVRCLRILFNLNVSNINCHDSEKAFVVLPVDSF